VLEINGKKISNWDQIYSNVYIESLGNDVTFLVDRKGAAVSLFLSRTAIPEPDQAPLGIVSENTDIVVGTVEPGMPAEKLGLKPNDVLLALNGTPLRMDQKVREAVQASAGKPMEIEWRRNGEVMRGTAIPTSDGRIGITFGARYNGPITRVRYSLLEALPRGIRDIGNVTTLFIQQIWQIITGKTPFSQSVGGPIRIAQMATRPLRWVCLPTWDSWRF